MVYNHNIHFDNTTLTIKRIENELMNSTSFLDSVA